MDISINNNTNIQKPAFDQSMPTGQQKTKIEKPVLSISNTPASLDDDMDINVPDAALTRNDELGNLISKAFNLPAPQMPKFE